MIVINLCKLASELLQLRFGCMEFLFGFLELFICCLGISSAIFDEEHCSYQQDRKSARSCHLPKYRSSV